MYFTSIFRQKVGKVQVLNFCQMISNPSPKNSRLVQAPKDVPRSEVYGHRQNFLENCELGWFMGHNVFFRVQKFEKIKIFEFQKFKCTISNTLYAKVYSPNIRSLLSKLACLQPFENWTKMAIFGVKITKLAPAGPLRGIWPKAIYQSSYPMGRLQTII